MHTNARTTVKIVLALLLAAIAGPWAAVQASPTPAAQPEAEATLPDAASLFEAYIEASGGMDNHLRQKDRTLHGVYNVLANGDTQILTLYVAAPDKLRAELEAPGLGLTIRCTNGATAWGTNVAGAPFEMGEQAGKELADGAFFMGEVSYKDRYESITTTGIVTFDGKEAYQVDFISKSGLAGTIYFDKETGLIAGRQLTPTATSNGGPLVLVKEYKEFDGILLPTIQAQRYGSDPNPTIRIEFKWIESNTGEMPNFDPPSVLAPPPPPQPVE